MLSREQKLPERRGKTALLIRVKNAVSIGVAHFRLLKDLYSYLAYVLFFFRYSFLSVPSLLYVYLFLYLFLCFLHLSYLLSVSQLFRSVFIATFYFSFIVPFVLSFCSFRHYFFFLPFFPCLSIPFICLLFFPSFRCSFLSIFNALK